MNKFRSGQMRYRVLAILALLTSFGINIRHESAMSFSQQSAYCLRIDGNGQSQVYNPQTNRWLSLPSVANDYDFINEYDSPDGHYALDLYLKANVPLHSFLKDLADNSQFELNLPVSNVFSWASDGRYLAYVSGTDRSQVILINPRTRAMRIIQAPAELAPIYMLDWSPDDAYLMLGQGYSLSPTALPPESGFVSLDGTPISLRVKVSPINNSPQLGWSHEHLLAYVSSRTGDLNIADPAENGEKRLNIPTGAHVLTFQWSPDDRHLAVLLSQASIAPRLYLFDPQNPDGKRIGVLGLFGGSFTAGAPISVPPGWVHWSADGQSLYYAQDGDTVSLVAYHPATDTVDTISHIEDIGYLISPWTVNARYFTFASDQHTFKVIDLANDRMSTLLTLAASSQVMGTGSAGNMLAITSATTPPYRDYRLDLIDLATGEDHRPVLDGATNVSLVSPRIPSDVIQVWWTAGQFQAGSLDSATPSTIIDGYRSDGTRAYRFIPMTAQINIPQAMQTQISPDQSLMLMVRDGQPAQLELINSDQQKARLIGSLSGGQFNVDWSPDSAEFVINDGSKPRLFNRDGTLMSSIDLPVGQPQWIPCPQLF